MKWIFNSPVGRLSICQMRNGKYGLFYKDQLCSTSNRPETLADNVYTHTSDCIEWDNYDDDECDCPTDLSEWE